VIELSFFRKQVKSGSPGILPIMGGSRILASDPSRIHRDPGRVGKVGVCTSKITSLCSFPSTTARLKNPRPFANLKSHAPCDLYLFLKLPSRHLEERLSNKSLPPAWA